MIENSISPLRAPEPRHPGQATLFPAHIIDTAFAFENNAMAVSITIRLHRTPRQKCAACQKRRVCFYVGLGDVITSPPMCAKCSGIR